MKKKLVILVVLFSVIAFASCGKKATALIDVGLTENPGDKTYVKGGLVKRGEFLSILEERVVDGKKYYQVQIKDVSTKGWIPEKWIKDGELKEIVIISDADLLMRPSENSPKYNFRARAGQTAFEVGKNGDFLEIQFPALGQGTAFVKKDVIGSAADVKRQLTIPGLGKASISASSQFKRTGGTENEFDPRNLFDGSLQTAWCEGADGIGEGESITLFFDNPVTINKAEMVNGWTKGEAFYVQNGRIKKFRISSDYGSSADVELQDSNYDYQGSDISISGSRITITLDSIYKGTDPDTCISEIRLTGAIGAPQGY
jgi:hypothetical protein